jgi:hypothetical protein
LYHFLLSFGGPARTLSRAVRGYCAFIFATNSASLLRCFILSSIPPVIDAARGPTIYEPPSLFFSSRQMHKAAISAMSTPGATVTAYVCWPKKMSLPLSSLRSMRATTASRSRQFRLKRYSDKGDLLPWASSVMSAVVSNQLPRIVRTSCLPD